MERYRTYPTTEFVGVRANLDSAWYYTKRPCTDTSSTSKRPHLYSLVNLATQIAQPATQGFLSANYNMDLY